MGDRLATIDMGRKAEGYCVPLRGRAWSPSNTMLPGPRPTSVPSGILIYPTVWGQHTKVTGRTNRNGPGPLLVMVAQKVLFYRPKVKQ